MAHCNTVLSQILKWVPRWGLLADFCSCKIGTSTFLGGR